MHESSCSVTMAKDHRPSSREAVSPRAMAEPSEIEASQPGSSCMHPRLVYQSQQYQAVQGQFWAARNTNKMAADNRWAPKQIDQLWSSMTRLLSFEARCWRSSVVPQAPGPTLIRARVFRDTTLAVVSARRDQKHQNTCC